MFGKNEQSNFEFRPVIEQKPFENPAVQSFLEKWCEVNDSITPQFIQREEWDKLAGKEFLAERAEGGKILFLPTDLRLWEMVTIIEAIDKDTFPDNLQKAEKKKEEIMELGKMFYNSGVYIGQRIGSICEGKNIAATLAEEFHDYGRKILGNNKQEKRLDIDDLAKMQLAPEEVVSVEKWLAGDDLYNSRAKRAASKALDDPKNIEDIFEQERRKTLAQFFRTTERAFELSNKFKKQEASLSRKVFNLFQSKIEKFLGNETIKNAKREEVKYAAWKELADLNKSEWNEDNYKDKVKERKNLNKIIFTLKPWKSKIPVHDSFIDGLLDKSREVIETPDKELSTTFFRRGMELLKNNIGVDKLPEDFRNQILHIENGDKTLREALRISEQKEELSALRKTGDLKAVSQKEEEIALKIQSAVSEYLYKESAYKPSEMAANQEINCVGASTLGGALMEEAGLKYLVGSVPGHSVLLLITSDGRVIWSDMLHAHHNDELADKEIEGWKKDGNPITTQDIVEYSKTPSKDGMFFDLPRYRKKWSWMKGMQLPCVAVFGPEYGQNIQVLNSVGNALASLNKNQEALAALRKMYLAASSFETGLYSLGRLMQYLGYFKEAQKSYQRAISLDPSNSMSFYMLGNTYGLTKCYEEAIECFRRAIINNPDYDDTYYMLGNALFRINNFIGALEAYKKFVDLADEEENKDWIKKARKIIEMLTK